ncbi:transposase [Paracoccus versutus]|uniref:transposase n=1 Tax=Paracoccus versutus TaxID=34007 RepID=UPI000DF81340|nr:hypothetical protein DVR11_25135 [Paracoccus versutus]
MPELGQLDRRRIAALVGLAPHANELGHRRGKRSIWGGRAAIRPALYLAALTASRFDPRVPRLQRALPCVRKGQEARHRCLRA